MRSFYRLLLLTFVLALTLFDLPLFSPLARFGLHYFLLGYLFVLHQNEKESVLSKSILWSILFTVAGGMLLGYLFPVAGFMGRMLFALVALALGFSLRDRTALPALRPELPHLLMLLIFASLPFLLLTLFNPAYALISDGWWHCSILNTIQLDKLPPANPWYSSATLAYPTAYHVYLSYAAGNAVSCLDIFNLFAPWMVFAASLVVFLLVLEFFGPAARPMAFVAAILFMYVSHLGGLGLIFDLLTKLPALGVQGYLDFLYAQHGPHVYYGALYFIGANVLTPLQQATQISGMYIFAFAAFLYLLVKRNPLRTGVALAVLFYSNPLLGITGAIIATLYLLILNRKESWKQLVPIAILALFLNAGYLATLAGKAGASHASRLGFSLDMLPSAAWNMAGFLLGYLPLLGAGIISFRSLRVPEHRYLLICLVFTLLLALLIMQPALSYLFIVLPVILAVAAAPFFLPIFQHPQKQLPLLLLIALLVIPAVLVVATYSYYKIPLSTVELEASEWLRLHTPTNAVVLPSTDFVFAPNVSVANCTRSMECLPTELNIRLYPAVFGERKLYLGDPMTLLVYGQDSLEGLKLHRAIFVEKNAEVICTARERGVDYLYSNQEKFYLDGSADCLEKVYENEEIRIYRVR